MVKLALVTPCYNEEDILEHSLNTLTALYDDLVNRKIIDPASFIILIDDGSSDRTWAIIESYSSKKYFLPIKLSKNFGQYNAILAGLEVGLNHADCFITIDIDLQDDLKAIEEMVTEYTKGNQVVYGVRSSRKKDSLVKRTSGNAYYSLMNKIGVKTVKNHSEFRLMSNKVIEKLFMYNEGKIFIRGIIPQIGFKSSIVLYERQKRVKGKTKYSLKKLLSIAWNSVINFSNKPIKYIYKISIVFFLISLTIASFGFYDYLKNKNYQFSIILFSIYFVAGFLFLSLGILGDYIANINAEVKKRPRYFIQEVVDNKNILS